MRFSTTMLMASSLSSLVSTAVLPFQTRQATVQTFYLIAARSATPIHLTQFQARDFRLWLGGETSTFCMPSQGGDVVIPCSEYRNVTAFRAPYGSPVELQMDTQVEGGQTLFIASDGSVQYTQPGNDCIPEDALSEAWTYSAPGSNAGNMYGAVAPTNASRTWLACPATSDEKKTGPWQLFVGPDGAEAPSGSTDDCYAFTTIANTFSGLAAFEYQ